MPTLIIQAGVVLSVIVVVALGLGALLVPLAILRGWVLSILWGWFMVPIFNLPALGIAQAIGVGIVVTTFAPTPETCKKPDGYKEWHGWVATFLKPLIGLAIGYIAKRFA